MTTPKSQVTHNIEVSVVSRYIVGQSVPSEEHFVFSYTINIKNLANETVTLRRRSWLITDADGKTVTVEGEGVVGEQPVIGAGKEYTYTSGCILKTPLGNMQGFYTMETSEGESIDVSIPIFTLAIPNLLH